MQSIYNLDLQDLENVVSPRFRAKQIFDWIYNKYCLDFEDMSNLSSSFKEELKKDFCIKTIDIIKIQESKDGSKKYLFKTHDNLTFESVFLKMKDKKTDELGRIIESEKYTFCLSSQIGCKIGCSFCFTAKGGFSRNLLASEIVQQVVFLKKDNKLDSNKRVNIVFMGMGEPLDNLSRVSKAVQIISNENGLAISTKRQTISTSGIAPKIKELAALNLGVQLAISLHAVDDELRSKLMPINNAYNIKSVIDALRSYPLKNGRKILFEYLVIKDVNDDIKSAKNLVKLLNGIKAKVNLIFFNPHEGSPFKRPKEEKVREFADFLYKKGITATIRISKGVDIDAACGQLKAKSL